MDFPTIASLGRSELKRGGATRKGGDRHNCPRVVSSQHRTDDAATAAVLFCQATFPLGAMAC